MKARALGTTDEVVGRKVLRAVAKMSDADRSGNTDFGKDGSALRQGEQRLDGRRQRRQGPRKTGIEGTRVRSDE